MVFTKKEAYIKQILIYINQHKFVDSSSLANEFTQIFPNELVSHFFLAKSLFYLKNYEEAMISARKAFNMSRQNDVITTGVLLGSILYLQNDLAEGYKLLESIEKQVGNAKELQELMAVFALALNNPERAAEHMSKLLDLNKNYGDGFILTLLG
ncbi:MAG TPA: hypothetical protein VI912_03670 [Candidatus Bilamarchaeaceae archaeon]|nr:hypothetical protein [Candidatus Bilamarchaeaceae archaeon]